MLLFALLACGGDKGPSPGGGDDTGGTDGPDPSTWRSVLTEAADIGDLADDTRQVKYTAPIEALPREEPIVLDCYFQDMVVWPWHMQFLRAFPGLHDLDLDTYTAWVVANDTRRWWGGEVYLLPGSLHPVAGVPGVMAFTFWADDSAGGPTVDHVAEVYARMKTCAPWAAEMAAWVPDGSAELALAETAAKELAAAGIPWLPAEQVREAMPAEILVEGTTAGVLGAEIAVLEAIPEDTSGIVGLIVGEGSADDPGIDALQKAGVPVAVAPWAIGNSVVDALIGARVAMEASGGGLLVYPIRPPEK